jgi:hypothetical protein
VLARVFGLSLFGPERISHADAQPQAALARIRKVVAQQVQLTARSPVPGYDVLSTASQHPGETIVRRRSGGHVDQLEFCACVGKTELCFTEDIDPVLVDLSAIEKNAWSEQPVLQMVFLSHQAYRRQLECADDVVFPRGVIVRRELNVVSEVPAGANVETVAIAAGDVRPSAGELQALGGRPRRERQPAEQQRGEYPSYV